MPITVKDEDTHTSIDPGPPDPLTKCFLQLINEMKFVCQMKQKFFFIYILINVLHKAISQYVQYTQNALTYWKGIDICICFLFLPIRNTVELFQLSEMKTFLAWPSTGKT